jgi:hypothetical protein
MNAQRLEVLPRDECVARLRLHVVGRIAFVVDDGPPIVHPVNYRLVETASHTWIALRTRPGARIDQAEQLVSFEVDEVDRVRHEGWSVLVRGTLHHIDPDVPGIRDRFDPEPWVLEERDSWLIVEPFDITGRMLHAAELEWAFATAAYL